MNLALISFIGGVSFCLLVACQELESVAPQREDPRAGSLGRATVPIRLLYEWRPGSRKDAITIRGLSIRI
jgi:hypothetical protein